MRTEAVNPARVWSRRLSAVLLVLAVSVPDAPALAESSSAASIRAVTWNICGWKVQDACRYPSIGAKAAEIKNVIDLRDANVVLLQEACQAHVAELARILGPEWTLHATPYMRWTSSTSSRPIWCGNDHPGSADAIAYGSVNVVVGIKEAGIPASQKTVEYLPGFTGTNRWRHPLLCVSSFTLDVRACTSHLTWPGEWDGTSSQVEEQNMRRAQVSRIVERLADDPRAVVGGDFNTWPPDGPDHAADQIVGMYDAFRECDQAVYGDLRAGRPTNGGYRIDYIFGHGTWSSCNVEPRPYRDDPAPKGRRYLSDHAAVSGELLPG